MAWTKRKLVEDALEEIGLASYVFDISPEEMNKAIRRMDGMMAEWDSKGIHVGYALPSGDSGSDPDQDSGLPDVALEAVRLNTAVRIGPSYGKTVSLDTKIQAKRAYDTLLGFTSQIPEMMFPETLPVGAGNKPLMNTEAVYFPTPDRGITVGNDSELDLG